MPSAKLVVLSKKKKQGPESRYHHILVKSSHTETPRSSLFTGENIPSCQTEEIKI